LECNFFGVFESINFGTWFKKIQNFPEKFHQQISDKIKQTFPRFTQPKLCKQFPFDKKNLKQTSGKIFS
jgi:hypothetical protein